MPDVDPTPEADVRMEKAVVGDRIRRIRLQMGLSIRELAAMAGVSKMSVVNLEQGKNFRESTLQKLAQAMGLHTQTLARPSGADAQTFAVHRRDESSWYDLADFARGPYVRGDLTPKQMRALLKDGCKVPLNILASRLELGRIKPTVMVLVQESETRAHQGEEYVYVLDGVATVTIAGQVVRLESGESVTFWSGEPHSYGTGDPDGAPATILSVRVDT